MPFQSPNYTQIPNDLFEKGIIDELTGAQLKVLLVICRRTFGYHQTRAAASLREIAEITGLREATVLEAGQVLESMGLVKKYNEGQHTTEWEPIVKELGGTKNVPERYDNRTGSGTKNVPQLGLNKKENIKETQNAAAVLPAEPERPNIYRVYEQEIGPLTPSIATSLEDAVKDYTEAWVIDALKVAAQRGNRNWRYAAGILKRWYASGKRDTAQPTQARQAPAQATPEGGFYV